MADVEGWDGIGTNADPYIITGYQFENASGIHKLYFGNLTLVFALMGCTLTDSELEVYNVMMCLVENNTFERGTIVLCSTRAKIVDNTFKASSDRVLSVLDGSMVDVANNAFMNCTKWGVSIESGQYHNVTGNLLVNTGLWLDCRPDNRVEGNVIRGGSIWIGSLRTRITNNTIWASNITALYLSGAKDSVVMDNSIEISDLRKGWQERDYTFAMKIGWSEGLTVKNNTMRNAGIMVEGPTRYMSTYDMDESNTVDGIPILLVADQDNAVVTGTWAQCFLVNCDDFEITGLNMTCGGYNLLIGECNGGRIHHNMFSGYFDNPIVVSWSDGVVIERNVFVDGDGWVEVQGSDDVLLHGNYFFKTASWDAVRYWTCARPNMTRNYFEKMQDSAAFFYFQSSDGTVTYNHFKGGYRHALDIHRNDYLVHHNFFEDNNLDPVSGDPRGRQAATTGPTPFDDGREGNYWSDYVHWYPSASNDGSVWDQPYGLEGGKSQDNHPLVEFQDTVPPIAFVVDDVSIDLGGTLVLDGGMSLDNVGIDRYRWTFEDDGPVALDGIRPSYAFNDRGKFDVVLHVSDAAGNWDEAHLVVHVLDREPPVARAGDDITIDQGDSVDFNGRGSTDNIGIVSFGWAFEYGGADIVRDTPAFTFWFHTPGTYSVTLTVIDADGNIGIDTVVVIVLDTERPRAHAGEDVTIDQGDSIRFSASGSTDNVGVIRWRWSFEYDGETIERDVMTFSFRFERAGEFCVTLRVFDSDGNWDETDILVTVIDAEPPVVDAGPDLTMGQGEVAEFNASGCTDNVEIYSWAWSFEYRGRNVSLRGPYPTFVFEDVGCYTVVLKAMDWIGNYAHDEVNVTVRDTTPPLAMIVLTYSLDQNTSSELNGTMSEDNVGISNWTWAIVHERVTDTMFGPTVECLFSFAGYYTVTLTVIDFEGNQNTSSAIVSVRDVEPPVAVSQGEINVKAGKRAMFDGSLSTDNVGVVNWTWSLEYKGRSYRGYGVGSFFKFDKPGHYVVTLIVADEAGLKDHTSFSVVVTEAKKTEDKGQCGAALAAVAVVLVAIVVMILFKRRRKAMPAVAQPGVAEHNPPLQGDERGSWSQDGYPRP